MALIWFNVNQLFFPPFDRETLLGVENDIARLLYDKLESQHFLHSQKHFRNVKIMFLFVDNIVHIETKLLICVI